MININDNAIIIDKDYCFSPQKTLECGQVFRYEILDEKSCSVVSGDKYAKITENNENIIITTDDINYFYNYFDLSTDYNTILDNSKNLPLMAEAIPNGYGIRMLKQLKFETLMSFIISANNRIPRIRKTLNLFAENLGQDMGGYYAFPTPEELANSTIAKLDSFGCGYRSKYILETANKINDGFDLEKLDCLPTTELLNELQTLKGVGGKVANCIALFAYERYDTFPVDTWIKKLAIDVYGADAEKISPKVLTEMFLQTYGEYAGICQQYLFFMKRKT